MLPSTLLHASASGVENLAELGAKTARYEAAREQRLLTAPLSILGPRGEITLESGTQLWLTRLIEVKAVGYAYVVAREGRPYGLVRKALLDAASQPLSARSEARGKDNVSAKALPLRVDAKTVENNAGLQRLPNQLTTKIVLTVDMCPRPDNMEEAFFTRLEALGRDIGKPIPVTLFMSGLWLDRRHPTRRTEIERLRKLDGAQLLFDFANHSATHPYEKGRPFERNFLLMKPETFDAEVLDAERAILRHGFVPAPAFRFPGLISTPDMRARVNDYFGLSVFGAGSWPALGQAIHGGDVILVHGNGGEPSGIAKLLRWFEAQRPRLRSGELSFADFTAVSNAK